MCGGMCKCPFCTDVVGMRYLRIQLEDHSAFWVQRRAEANYLVLNHLAPRRGDCNFRIDSVAAALRQHCRDRNVEPMSYRVFARNAKGDVSEVYDAATLPRLPNPAPPANPMVSSVCKRRPILRASKRPRTTPHASSPSSPHASSPSSPHASSPPSERAGARPSSSSMDVSPEEARLREAKGSSSEDDERMGEALAGRVSLRRSARLAAALDATPVWDSYFVRFLIQRGAAPTLERIVAFFEREDCDHVKVEVRQPNGRIVPVLLEKPYCVSTWPGALENFLRTQGHQ